MAVKLGYLIDPFQEVVDYNGLPIVGARIYVYKADTSIPVETYSDFLGHRNDWPVIADTLGNATVIAPYDQLYDIVIKNAQGELVMSKKRVSPHEAQGVDPTPVPDDNQYWIGTDGTIAQVTPDLQGTIIPLAEESDADQHFIHEITSDGRMILEDGLYLIQCVIDIQQDAADLHNTIENLTVMTGLDVPEDVIFERDEAGPDSSSSNIHSLKLSFIRHAQASEYTNELYFKIRTPVALSKAQNRRLAIVKLQSSVAEGGGGSSYSGEYTGSQYIYISPERVISVVGIDPDSYATHNEVSGVSASLREIINNVSGDIPDMSQYVTQQYFTENTSAFLTSADMSSYATNEYVDNYVYQNTSGLQEKLVFGYDEDDKINSINGSAIGGTGGTFTQVQSDWAQSATSAVDFIKNKPSQASLQAGAGISITKVGNDYVISSSGGSVDPSELSAYATKSWVEEQNFLTQSDLSSYATETYVLQETSGKLDANDYTAPVQSDWNQTDSSALDFIKNKPNIPSLAGYATETYVDQEILEATSGLQEKLTFGYDQDSKINAINGSAVAGGSFTQVQSNWSQTNTSAVDYIKNKPNMSNYATKTWTENLVDSSTSGKLDSSAYQAPIQYHAGAYIDIDQNNYINVDPVSQLVSDAGVDIYQDSANNVHIGLVGIPVYVVSTSAEAIGTNILYVVSGSN